MAKRGNRPKDPEDTKGGVRGTHGLGDIRDREKRDGQVALRTSNWDKNAAPPTHHVDIDEGTGEELEFDVSNAMAALESSDDRAAKREQDAAEVVAELEELDADAVLDPEERKERNLTTEVVPGPGPKDVSAGRATKQHLESHDLDGHDREGKRGTKAAKKR